MTDWPCHCACGQSWDGLALGYLVCPRCLQGQEWMDGSADEDQPDERAEGMERRLREVEHLIEVLERRRRKEGNIQ